MPPDIAIRSRGLTKHFGPVRAVNDLELDNPRSKIFGFLGPNGSGKSTTIRMLCGLLPASGGQLSVAGHNLRHAAAKAREHIAELFGQQVTTVHGEQLTDLHRRAAHLGKTFCQLTCILRCQ